MSDEWEQIEKTWYRPLPETSIDDLLNDERNDMLSIEHDGGSWWLSETGVGGAVLYSSLEEAKAAGDKQIAAMEHDFTATILTEAGLMPGEWRLDCEEGIAFVRDDGATIQTTQRSKPGRIKWEVYGTGEERLIGDMPSIAAAAATLPARRQAVAAQSA